MMLREEHLNAQARLELVPSQTTQILHQHNIDLPKLDIPFHPLKIGTIKVCSAPPIVRINLHHVKAILLRITLQ
ncbi:hypothetical protein D3C74_447460 [compost metagenome]